MTEEPKHSREKEAHLFQVGELMLSNNDKWCQLTEIDRSPDLIEFHGRVLGSTEIVRLKAAPHENRVYGW